MTFSFILLQFNNLANLPPMEMAETLCHASVLPAL